METTPQRNVEMIFLSKDGEDPYINMFAKGCNSPVVNTENFNYEDNDQPIILRGILKKKIIQRCWNDGRTFYFMDTGYFGNERTDSNPNGWKYWHRIVKNDLQHDEIINRPDDRYRHFNKKFKPWKKTGRKILIAAPDEKPCKFYGTTQHEWISNTVANLKNFTDRPIVVRERVKNRTERVVQNTLIEALDDDVFALVTFNSIAAIESVFHGIPAFTMAPNAARPVSLQDLSKINEPYYPDQDKLYAWACHLSYGQYHISELKSGKAKEYLEKHYG